MARCTSRPLPTVRQMLARAHLRLVLLAVLLSGVTLLASGAMTIRGYFERNLALVARTISYTVEPAVVFGDPEAIRDGIASVADLHEVRRVELRNPQGRLIASWTPAAEQNEPAAGGLAERLLQIRSAQAEVRHGQQVVGTIRVMGDASILAGYLLAGALISICCLGITMIAMRILGRRMEEDVVAPLAEIAAVAHEVRSQRAFDRRVPPSGIAEVDTFARDFNALLSELQGWHASLTEEKDKFEYDAMHDPLTALGNRALFERELDAAVNETLRSGEPFALLYLDADRFKQVNDAHGHLAGDALLVGIAQRLNGCIRDGDQAFRLGGDEFAVILVSATDHAMIATIVARIELAMTIPIDLPSGRAVSPSLSVGAAIYPGDGISPQDLLRRADEQMYEEKLRKRGGQQAQGYHA